MKIPFDFFKLNILFALRTILPYQKNAVEALIHNQTNNILPNIGNLTSRESGTYENLLEEDDNKRRNGSNRQVKKNRNRYKRQINSKITNGSYAPPTRYPYFGQSNPLNCGAVLIASKALLTAAHCANLFKGVVHVGYAGTSRRGEAIPIRRVIRHQSYNSRTFDYDYAVVLLRRPVRNKRLTPICLAKPRWKKSGKNFTVMGMGYTKVNRSSKINRSYPNRIKHTVVQYLQNGPCSRQNYNMPVTSRMICGTSRNNKDACQGDSGGPLILKGKTKIQDILVGIVSWGNGCGTRPGVYSDVSNQRSWIIRTVKNNGGGVMRQDCRQNY
uniref:Peptidase S1 domain-containing protein n=1 Tax=Corethron hystrix TaxID=216773 RepID=A0A7S1BD86_9STRA|mmetsp:Transcript_22377/g.51272  ORF Transcript_22377/g.51272 Transcript_22377/m.51272 type:complete len:328 (+) Transcript_22377:127-1110(+)